MPTAGHMGGQVLGPLAPEGIRSPVISEPGGLSKTCFHICKVMPSLSVSRALAWPLAGPGRTAVGHVAILGLRLKPAMVGRVQRHSAAVLGQKLLGNVTPHMAECWRGMYVSDKL